MSANINEEEETIADLVHYYVLPEVRKELVRQKIQAKQKQKLRLVHDLVYNELEEAPENIDSFMEKRKSGIQKK